MAHAAAAAVPLRRPFLRSLIPHHLFSTYSFPSSRPHLRALRPLGPTISDADADADGPYYDSYSDATGGGSSFEEATKKSRNELKREARRAVRWGTELSKFSPAQVKRVLRAASLEREVFDALMLVKRFGPDVREGRRRQFNYIGRLLRSAPPELMDALIQASKDGDNSRFFALSGQDTLSSEDDEEEDITYEEEKEEEGIQEYLELATRWFDGLICQDPAITNEVYAVHNVEFDRQELRKLVRRVHSIKGQPVDNSGEESNARLSRAKKPLLHFLRSLARKAYVE